jgi:hypothetical protein
MLLLTIRFFASLMVAAWYAIYKYNLGIVKRKCRDWDSTKSHLFYSKIGNYRAGVPSWQVTQNREELLRSEDYQIIVRQARLTYAQMVVALLAIFLILALVIHAMDPAGGQ